MKSKMLALTAVLLLISAVSGLAQEQTGAIFGTVKTGDGAVIEGVKVKATSSSLIRPREVTTNNRGYYIFPALPVGTYTLTFTGENYKTTEQTGISLSIGAQLRVNVTMETGVFEDLIVISGEAPLVDVKSTDTGMSISKELFNLLPKGRSFQSVVTLAPGAEDNPDHGGLYIDGASSSENVWIIDGAGVNNLNTGRLAQNQVFEFIEEVQIRSGGYEAEFGGSMGGVVNVITRSGGNEFHGEGTFYYEADNLNVGPRDSLRINPVDDVTPEYFENETDNWYQYEVGGALGGFIFKDRVWFFGSYIPRHRLISRTVNFKDAFGDTYLTRDYDDSRWTHNAAVKISSQLTSKLRTSASFNTDWYKRLGSLPGRDGLGNPEDNWEEQGIKNPGYTAAANVDYLMSDAFYVNGKFGWHMIDTTQLGIGTIFTEPRYYMDGSMVSVIPPGELATVPAQYINGQYWANYPWATFNATTKDFFMQYNWSADATYFTEMSGDHMFKGGVQHYWIKNEVLAGNPKQYYRFYWRPEGVVYTNPITGESGRGKYGWYRVLSYEKLYGLDGKTTSNRFAIFFQDSWSPTPRLTINAGLRLEKENLPSYNEDYADPFQFGFTDKIAPRIGVAYDWFGNGKLKVFANWGVYYDVMKLQMAREGYGGCVWKDARYTLDTFEWWTFPDKVGPPYPGTPIGPPVDWRIPALETTDPEAKPAGMFEYIAGADYQLSDNMAVNVRFVFKNLRRTIEDVGVITPHGEEYWHGNPGFGITKERLEASGYPVTKAKRNYYGLEVRVNKRFSNNWAGGANITISRLTGNYGGLTSSDEYGRASPNVNRYFDLWWLSFDRKWNEAVGPLQTDRRYAVKLFGSYTFDYSFLDGLTVGVYQTIQDGTPFSKMIQMNNLQGYYPDGRASEGRHDMLTQTDLYAEYNFKFGEYRAQFNINVTNLFDQDTAIRKYAYYDRDTPTFTDAQLLSWYNSKTPIDFSKYLGPGTGKRVHPLFGLDQIFQGPRTIRLGLKFFF